MLSTEKCSYPNCDRILSYREASSHNRVDGVNGKVCYPCYKQWYNNERTIPEGGITREQFLASLGLHKD